MYECRYVCRYKMKLGKRNKTKINILKLNQAKDINLEENYYKYKTYKPGL